MTSTELVQVSTVVELSTTDAFRLFTEDIDAWWKRAPRFRTWPEHSSVRFEGAPPTSLVERHGALHTTLGRVLTWEPGAVVVLRWLGGGFTEADGTDVEVRFSTHRLGTRVELVHRHLDALPPTHPVRAGLRGPALAAMYGYFWGELLNALRATRRSGA